MDENKPAIELLSPAGGMDAFFAALCNGADAVYLGAQQFGARSSAGFSDEDLATAIKTAHFYRKKTYVALNTLIKEKEFPIFVELVEQIISLGADAFIVQDTGVLRYIKEHHPQMPVHASTQMAIHNQTGAEFACRIGMDRVVFARETPLQCITKAALSGVETEVFAHGALCVAVSGQCLLSSVVGGRSGNRGRCAQPCRLQYAYRGRTDSWLSPKDISLDEHLDDVKQAGITSLKLEGRMKRAEYVAVVTATYREALDENKPAEQSARKDSLLQIFNRGSFSSGYLFGQEDAQIIHPGHVAHEGVPIGRILHVSRLGTVYLAKTILTLPLHDQDGLQVRSKKPQDLIYSGPHVPAGSEAVLRLREAPEVGSLVHRLDSAPQLDLARQSYVNRIPFRILLTASLTADPGFPCMLSLSDGESEITAEGEVVQEAKSAPLDAASAQKAVSKTGDTPYDIQSFAFHSKAPAFLPVSALNALRRTAIRLMEEARHKAYNVAPAKYRYHAKNDVSHPCGALAPGLTVMGSEAALSAFYRENGADRFFYSPLSYDPESLKQGLSLLLQGDALVLPKQCNDATLHMMYEAVCACPLPVVVQNISHLALDWPCPVIAGNGLHVWNRETIRFLQDQGVTEATCSLELTFAETKDLRQSSFPLLLTVYGRPTLMLLNHCPERVFRNRLSGHSSCRLCEEGQGTRGQALTDRMGCAYPLWPFRLPEGCINQLLDYRPLHLSTQAPSDYPWLLSFTCESKDEQEAILRHYRQLRQNEVPEALELPLYSGRLSKGVQ